MSVEATLIAGGMVIDLASASFIIFRFHKDNKLMIIIIIIIYRRIWSNPDRCQGGGERDPVYLPVSFRGGQTGG
jgi:hypothetical protein